MIDSDELLAIGAALVQTVRSKIKYSENIDNLYRGYKKSDFYKHRSKKLEQIYTLHLPYTPQGKQVYLKNGVGLCDELSLAILHIAQGLEEIKIGTFYLSLMSIYKKHVFLIAHNSLSLANNAAREWTKYKKSLRELKQDDELKNAVIIDPWIYKATKLSNLREHLEHAVLYDVLDYYRGNVMYIGQHLEINPSSNIIKIDKQYIDTFQECYKIQKEKLVNKRDSFAQGRRFSSVRRSLEYNIQKYQQLISLRDFFIRLKKKSSGWYTKNHSNRKGKAISSVINYLQTCIDNYYFPSQYDLECIFRGTLTVCAVVRGKNLPNQLSKDNITMTKTAKGIFSFDVVPNNKLAFEIDGLSLDWVREARKIGSDRSKYMVFLNKLEGWNPDFNVSKLYTNKENYYKLVEEAIASSQ
ncbi:hypothetical protein [Allofrancisella frigidaquae]|uniref:Uncharacterized protein n=1 Tax=Allofrancisella frigidaquae TaxID=1085644 RepID=A0A6M3HVU6_9GAMM|nr:hypothetical protein [Allofrancisella frigidaquae]QIV94342.1 hypothetical protein E3E15_02805 [Allofrancisella frigidaquae]